MNTLYKINYTSIYFMYSGIIESLYTSYSGNILLLYTS